MIFYIKKILAETWNLLAGIFLFGKQWRRQKKLNEDQDLHFHYKKKMQKIRERWAVQEQRFLSDLKKGMPKGTRKNYTMYNYLSTCVLKLRPNMTVEDAVKEFYDSLHPSYLTYHAAYVDLMWLLHLGEKDRNIAILKFKKEWKWKYRGSVDMMPRATEVLEKYKEEAHRIGREEREHRRQRQEKLNSIDKKHLKEDMELMRTRILEDQRTLKVMEKEMKNQGVGPKKARAE